MTQTMPIQTNTTSHEASSPEARRAYVASGMGWGLDGLTLEDNDVRAWTPTCEL